MSPEEAKRVSYMTLQRMKAKRGNITTRKGAAMMSEHRAGVRGQLRKHLRKVDRRTRARFGKGRMAAIRRHVPARSARRRT